MSESEDDSLPPKPNIIPEQFLSNPKLLLDKVYGINRVFGPVLDVTNKKPCCNEHGTEYGVFVICKNCK